MIRRLLLIILLLLLPLALFARESEAACWPASSSGYCSGKVYDSTCIKGGNCVTYASVCEFGTEISTECCDSPAEATCSGGGGAPSCVAAGGACWANINDLWPGRIVWDDMHKCYDPGNGCQFRPDARRMYNESCPEPWMTPEVGNRCGDYIWIHDICESATDQATCASKTVGDPWNNRPGCTWYTDSMCGPAKGTCLDWDGTPHACPAPGVAACTLTDPANSCGWWVCKNICGDNTTTSTCNGSISCCYASPPSTFNPLVPANGATDQPISVVLTTDISASYYWGRVCSPTVQTNTLTFYLAEGNVSPTVAVSGCSFTASPANSNNISVSCPLSGLKYNQQYSWRVLARNGNTGATGETYAPATGYWTFTTRALPAWWQVTQGDIYGMSVQSTIPNTCIGTCRAYIELD